MTDNCPKCHKPLERMEKEGDDIHNYLVCHPCEYVLKRARCEVYSRVCGYLRPVSGYNKGKKEEFKDRKTYKVTEPS